MHMHLFLVLALFVSGCAASITGSVVQDGLQAPEGVQKTLVQKEPMVKETQEEVAEERPEPEEHLERHSESSEASCAERIAVLQEELDQQRSLLLQVNANVTKSSLLLSYLSKSHGREEDYERQLEVLEEHIRQRKDVEGRIQERIVALKLLAEKCHVKVKLTRD